MHAAIYLRMSEETDESGASIERQRHDCEALTKRRGWLVAGEYVDTASAWSKRAKRPQFQRMLEAVREGRAQAVVVYDIDRLTRTPRDLEDLIDLCEDGGVAFATCQGDVNLATSDGRAMARVLVTMARKSSDDTSRRVRRQQLQRAENGLPHGQLAYGYRRSNGGIEIDPARAAIVRQAADAILGGASLRSTARKLAWSSLTLRRLLLNPALTGKVVMSRNGKKEPAYQGNWPAILSEAEQTLLIGALRRPENVARGNVAAHLLSGIVRCGSCGSALVTFRNRGRRTYACRECWAVSVRGEPVDAMVTTAVLHLAGGTRPATLTRLTLDADDAELSSLRQQKDDMGVALGEGRLTIAQVERANAVTDRRIAEIQQRIHAKAAALVRAAQTENLRSRWGELELDERRAAIKAEIERVVIQPVKRGGVFNPERVRIVWLGETEEEIAYVQALEDEANR